jgi:hypothetical protein
MTPMQQERVIEAVRRIATENAVGRMVARPTARLAG